jgi:hypothetical protein
LVIIFHGPSGEALPQESLDVNAVSGWVSCRRFASIFGPDPSLQYVRLPLWWWGGLCEMRCRCERHSGPHKVSGTIIAPALPSLSMEAVHASATLAALTGGLFRKRATPRRVERQRRAEI